MLAVFCIYIQFWDVDLSLLTHANLSYNQIAGPQNMCTFNFGRSYLEPSVCYHQTPEQGPQSCLHVLKDLTPRLRTMQASSILDSRSEETP